MEEEIKSEGVCIYCEEVHSQKEIGKHLAKHLLYKQKESVDGKTNKYTHIEVEVGPYFLQLLVKNSVTLKKIDNFLRDIWLECCGHMSEFSQKNIDVKMSDKVGVILTPTTKIQHDYDFGSTTRSYLKANKCYELAEKGDVILLSRNEPAKFICSICKAKPAMCICLVCCDERESLFCEDCASKHAKECDDFEDYALANIYNSPRAGECGYEGGRIDLARDGIYAGKI